ncbi:hypothetical protein [Gilvimarinus sp. 1_MG-2023]|uniref:hypothetical protein n=1 Tax=Gilvimarinus sp. 1_MG-2023 TaxID=3062638 RepID=UPI0026E15DCB|nr:hypothetical protein [Gilvimarinus sp. 1_MG-2023]MDO6747189.1 hypothetical protein [Gilvimarinus sp. 1_MG-2023]
MASPKRTPSQIARDRADIADMYLRGWQQVRIAEHLTQKSEDGIQYSLDMVRRDLREVRAQWRKSALIDFDAAKQEQLAKLDMMECQVWDQWLRSCEDYKKHTTGKGAQGPIDKTETGGQTGDPRYMNVLLSIIERRCKLLGLDAPTKVAPTDPDGKEPYNPPSSEEATKRIAELMAKLNYAGGN